MSDEVSFAGHVGDEFVIDDHPPTFAPADAYEKFRAKSIQFYNTLGSPLVDGLAGVQDVHHGYRQLHERGAPYLRRDSSVPYSLNQSLDAAYVRLGNSRSFLGFPVADVLRDPDDDVRGSAAGAHDRHDAVRARRRRPEQVQGRRRQGPRQGRGSGYSSTATWEFPDRVFLRP